MLRSLACIAVLTLAGSAAAHVVSTTPISVAQDCPGFHPFNYIHTVIPRVSTLGDTLDKPMGLTLTIKDWGSANGSVNWLRICAVSPEGAFMGGSVVQYTYGSRLTIHQTTGTDGLSLESIVGPAAGSLNYKTFQLYIGIGASNNARDPQMEFGQTGNKGQYMVSAPVPKRVESFISMAEGDTAPFSTTYFLSNPEGGSCQAAVSYLDDDGKTLSTSYVPIAEHGSVAINASGAKGVNYSSVVVSRNNCSPFHVMRLVEYPSAAQGGHTAVLTTSR